MDDKIDEKKAAGLYKAAAVFSRIYHRAELQGEENIPRIGAALLVSNHGRMGYEIINLFQLIYARTGRFPRPLAEHFYFNNKSFGRLLGLLGVVDGTRENAVSLLRQGELAICYPGGVQDIQLNSRGRERIFWEGHFGFVKVALQARAPIIPIASIGNNDGLINLNKGNLFAKIVFGLTRFSRRGSQYRSTPLPFSIGILPLPLTAPLSWLFPLPVKLKYFVGAPIEPAGPPGAADDPETVRRLHRQVVETMTGMLERHAGRSRFSAAG
jgi:1-acyl-sn-glycerol-3-phosphate acyltransferase